MSDADALTEFLTARLDEDEAVAREALEEGGSYDDAEIPWAGRAGDDSYSREHAYGASWVELRVARALADVEAKRAIVVEHKREHDYGDVYYCAICLAPDTWDYELKRAESQRWPCRTMRALALPYAEHEDYDEEWRP